MESPNQVLKITDLSRGGSGVGRESGGRVVFVPFTAPGDVVRVRISEDSEMRKGPSHFAQGDLVEILERSPMRIEPRCQVFGRCGGCDWQHIPYSLQWQTKVQGAKSALKRAGLGGLAETVPWDELPADQIWEYRNRIQLRVQGGKVGYLGRRSKDIVPAESCPIARPEINAAWAGIASKAPATEEAFQKVEVETNPSDASQVLLSWNARHGVRGFRQVHDEQNQKLRQWVRDRLLTPPSTGPRALTDLYGGTGNLSAGVRDLFEAIDCVDLGARGIRDIKEAKITFHQCDVGRWLKRATRPRGKQVDWVLDPPREGLGEDGKQVVKVATQWGVDRVISVGCDADSWSRDLARWVNAGWRLERVGVLDFFPQTHHVETLAALRRSEVR